MMRRDFAFILCLLAGSVAHAAPTISVSMKGGALQWSADKAARQTAAQWLSVRDLAAGETFAAVAVTGDGASFSGAGEGLRFSGEWTNTPRAAVLHCVVTADPPRDRALTVRVAIPIGEATGQTWWDDINDRRTIEAGKSYSRTASWYGLREVSIYPLCAVTDQEDGLSLAVPADEPRVFRLRYDPGALVAEFDLGLSPEATKLGGATADFKLYLYSHDPRSGFRGALQRYYDLFPAYTKRRVEEAGIWLLGFRPEAMACPWDFGFKFDEGAQSHALYDETHDILSYVYTEPFGKYENFGQVPSKSGKPEYGETAPPLSPEELRQAILKDVKAPETVRDRHFPAPRRLVAQADANSAIQNHDGTWVWRHWTNEWSSDGSWISNITLNCDPELPAPNRAALAWSVELDPAFAVARQQGSDLSGVYIDSVCGFMGTYNENFRREHWRTADAPLVASTKFKEPCLLHGFSCWEFTSQVAERMWAQGKTMIGNTGRPEMQVFCPKLDMIGAGETARCGMANDEHYRYLRTHSYGKPVSWMDYGFVSPEVSWEEKERGLQRCLFYAVHPGTGSFEDPAKYEPSRPLFRYYEPLIQWVDQAGWKPVTAASATDETVLVERYGPGTGGMSEVTFIALRNPGKEAVTTAVRVQQEALPASCRGANTKHCVAWRLVNDGPAPTQWISSKVGDFNALGTVRKESLLNLMSVDVPADGTEVVALGRREAVAGLWLSQAQRWADRLDREMAWLSRGGNTLPTNGNFEAGMSAWGIDNNAGKKATVDVTEQQPISGKGSLRAVSEADDSFQSLHQSLTLTPGETYTLSFKYTWTRPEGAKGSFYPRFGVKGPDGNWASDKYLYFREMQPTDGKVVAYEKQFTIPEGHTAGYFQFMFEGNWGTVTIDDVEITSPKQEQSRQGLAELQRTAHDEAGTLAAALRSAKPVDLVALGAAQRPVYEKLRDLAKAVPEEHLRRCVSLPVSDFAEALGRMTEVATGVVLKLDNTIPGEETPFLDVGAGTQAQVLVDLSGENVPKNARIMSDSTGSSRMPAPRPANPSQRPGIDIMMPDAIGWGWTDVGMHAMAEVGGREVWIFRRITVRLHPPLQVEAVGPASSVRDGIPFASQWWIDGMGTMAAELTVGGQTFSTHYDDFGGGAITLPLAKEALGLFDGAARELKPAKLKWTVSDAGAPTLRGEADVTLVRGVRCPKLGGAPVLDGTVGGAEWGGAASITDFVTPAEAKPAARKTTVLLGHDAKNLYIAFTCSGQLTVTAAARPRDGAVWEDDAVEVFLQPEGSEAYYHLGVNANGAILDGKCDPAEDTRWDGKWEAKTARTADGYVVEMAIPFATLGAKAEGGWWRVNFGREEADTHVPTCWNPTLGGFHVPGRFGEMAFD